MQTKHLGVPFEIKGMDDEGVFEGYGSIYGNVDLGDDVVVKGACGQSLAAHKAAGSMPAMLWYHSPRDIPGVWTEMEENGKGVYAKGRFLMDTQLGRETYSRAKAKALRGLSIGYSAEDYAYEKVKGRQIRMLKRIGLHEVSLVTFPMNPKALIGTVKAADLDADSMTAFLSDALPGLAAAVVERGWKDATRDFEKMLRDEAGFSNAAAKAIAVGGFKATPEPRDEDGTGALTGLMDELRAQSERLRT